MQSLRERAEQIERETNEKAVEFFSYFLRAGFGKYEAISRTNSALKEINPNYSYDNTRKTLIKNGCFKKSFRA
jgi:hypothetical protein